MLALSNRYRHFLYYGKTDFRNGGKNHLLQDQGGSFDSEGLLSTLPAVSNVVAGYVAGKFIQQRGTRYETLAKLIMVGFFLFLIAVLWNYGFPINKKMWTSSFALISSGIDCMLLACIIFVIDFVHFKKGVFFFEVFGKNPLFIYIFSIVLLLTAFLIPVGNTILINWTYEIFLGGQGTIWGLFFLLFVICFCAGVFVICLNGKTFTLKFDKASLAPVYTLVSN